MVNCWCEIERGLTTIIVKVGKLSLKKRICLHIRFLEKIPILPKCRYICYTYNNLMWVPGNCHWIISVTFSGSSRYNKIHTHHTTNTYRIIFYHETVRMYNMYLRNYFTQYYIDSSTYSTFKLYNFQNVRIQTMVWQIIDSYNIEYN